MENGISINHVIGALARGRITRREAVRLLLASGAAATLLPALGRADDGTVAGIPLARPDRPVTLPTLQKPIESGLEPESGGSFYIFNYDEYVDPKLMEAFGKKYDIDGIIHLAVPGIGALGPFEDFRTNMNGLVNAMQAAKDWGVKRISIASSIAVYPGIKEVPYREDMYLPLVGNNPTEAGELMVEIVKGL